MERNYVTVALCINVSLLHATVMAVAQVFTGGVAICYLLPGFLNVLMSAHYWPRIGEA